MSHQPFVIHALPRSRTYWLSQFLAYDGRIVGHDLGGKASSCQDFVDQWGAMAGTVETGSMFAHSLLKTAFPAARTVTIRRPWRDVAASLARFGINDIEDELIERDRHLDAIEAAGAERVEYDDLADVRCCSALFENLLGVSFDFRHWRAWDAINCQVDMPAWLARLHERREQIEALKSEADHLIKSGSARFVRLGWENFADISEEVTQFACAAYMEVNPCGKPGHPYRLNVPLLVHMETSGNWRIMCARVNNRLAGYITWSFVPDAESEGVIIADQGAWFVADEFANLHLGRRMLERSIADLKQAGVHSVQLHHPVNGRGAKLGTMFRRMGAIENQHRYSLWIGD